MRVPYHELLPCGDVLFAARGGKLHSFSIKDGSHLSTWEPSSLKREELLEGTPEHENGTSVPGQVSADGRAEAETPAADSGDSGPPTKRRKVENEEEAEEGNPDQEPDAEAGEGDVVEMPRKQRKRGKKKRNRNRPFPFVDKPAERHLVQCLTATDDGVHIVAVTSPDKIIWVFEHDGHGSLKQLTQRAMPKRPCSIALTTDNKTILSADKFGDVISLPLIPRDDDLGTRKSPQSITPSSTPATPATPATPVATPQPFTHQPFKPRANELTVHTKRNLRALANQERLKLKPQVGGAPPRAPTEFEHSILIGHVSMLTALAVTIRSGKSYIVTGDRDEHVRVSRGAPQAHVVQTFCLGHGDFVSRLCVPAARPEILVSGGGDDELFVWDWFAGALLSTTDVLPLVRDVLPEATHIAVSTLRAFHQPSSVGDGGNTWVVVGCEAVPALFCFRLEGNSLVHAQTVRLEGNLLDAVAYEMQTSPRILAALDSRHGSGDEEETQKRNPSLVTLSWDEKAGWQPSQFPVAALDDDAEEITLQDLKRTLYTLESLRKREYDDEPSAE